MALTARDTAFRDDPDASYDRLRAAAPVYADPDYGRWVLTRHADVRTVLRQKDFGVDARNSRADSYTRRIAGTGVQEASGATAYAPPLVLLDDPAHRRIRLLMSKAFTPRAVAAMRPRIEAITASLLDGLDGQDAIDFIADYAGPLPTLVIRWRTACMPRGATGAAGRRDLPAGVHRALSGAAPRRHAAAAAQAAVLPGLRKPAATPALRAARGGAGASRSRLRTRRQP